MIYNKPLQVDDKTVIVQGNTPIKEEDIKKLMKWGVSEIETAGILIKSVEAPTAPVISINESEKKILGEYNDLLKKRINLIEVHTLAWKSVENAHAAIKANKPFSLDPLIEASDRIISLMRGNSNIFLFLYGLEEGKDYLVAHSVNVAFYSAIIGLGLKYPDTKLRDLLLGTLLIDSGMLKIPVYIIHKQSNLTDVEFNQIKTHPLHGYRVLKELARVKDSIANVTLQHHEQFDGKGYPRGIKGSEIDEFARIASIADSYESQISNRSYKKKVFFYHAMRNLLSSGVSKFDPVILRVFLSMMSVYPIGSIVELNDSRIGIVIGSVHEKPLRPMLKIIFDKEGRRLTNTVIINLLEESSLYILRAMDESEAGINIFDVL
jgi:HD-GYP domain-containing protein (c-di-GMP phosphodiesterase class II)